MPEQIPVRDCQTCLCLNCNSKQYCTVRKCSSLTCPREQTTIPKQNIPQQKNNFSKKYDSFK
jgi:hypothetical protein